MGAFEKRWYPGAAIHPGFTVENEVNKVVIVVVDLEHILDSVFE